MCLNAAIVVVFTYLILITTAINYPPPPTPTPFTHCHPKGEKNPLFLDENINAPIHNNKIKTEMHVHSLYGLIQRKAKGFYVRGGGGGIKKEGKKEKSEKEVKTDK